MSFRTDLAAIGLARVVQVAIMFATYRALTHLLSPDELGSYFFFLGLSGAIGLIGVNPVGTYVNRFLHEWARTRSIGRYGLYFIGFSLLAGFIALLTTLGIGPTINKGSTLAALSLGIYVVGNTLANTFIPAINMLGHAVLFSALTVISQLASVLVAIYATQQNSAASTWLWSYGATYTLFGIIGYLCLRRLHDTQEVAPTPQQEHSLNKFVWPLALSNIGLWTLTQGYRPLGAWLSGLEALAFVGLGLGIASSIANAFELLVQQIFLPKFFRETHSDSLATREQNWLRLWHSVLPLYIAVACFTIGFSKVLLGLLSSSTYENAWRFVAIGAAAEIFRMLSGTLNLISISELKTKHSIAPYLAGGSTFVVLALSKVPIELSVVIGQAVTLVIMLWKFRTAKWHNFSGARLDRILISSILVAPIFFAPPKPLFSIALLVIAGTILSTLLLLTAKNWGRNETEVL